MLKHKKIHTVQENIKYVKQKQSYKNKHKKA